MAIDSAFSQKAGQDRPLIAEVKFADIKEWPESIVRDQFRKWLADGCNKFDIVCGLNETEDGFQLGFEHPNDYEKVMSHVEAKLQIYLEHLAAIRDGMITDSAFTEPDESESEDWDEDHEQHLDLDNTDNGLSEEAKALLRSYEERGESWWNEGTDEQEQHQEDPHLDFDYER